MVHALLEHSGPRRPLWLEEGFAEYVGYRGTGIPVNVAVSDVVTRLRHGGHVVDIPAAADFTGPRIALAYEQAYLACLEVAAAAGQSGLVRLYRLTQAGSGTPQENVAHAVRVVTGLSWKDFVAAVHHRSARVAGHR